MAGFLCDSIGLCWRLLSLLAGDTLLTLTGELWALELLDLIGDIVRELELEAFRLLAGEIETDRSEDDDEDDIERLGELYGDELIGEIGASGRATGAHLDWRMSWRNQRIDPQLLAPPMPAQEPASP